MEEVRLFDTASRAVKPLTASDGKDLKFYACGPTVYGPAHIGNFRSFVVQDLLVRVWEATGGKVRHVRNLTDVDDKTIKGARDAKQKLGDFTQGWTDRFWKNGAALGLKKPTQEPKATEFIPKQIALVERLVKSGHAYESGGSVYYRVKSFANYGKLFLSSLFLCSLPYHNDNTERILCQPPREFPSAAKGCLTSVTK